MKKILGCFFALSTLLLHAQNENKKWYFGQNAGIDFSTGTATVMTGSAMQGLDFTTTVCDATGNLQFYAMGTTVYNRNHAVMSNGTGLMGNASAGQEVVAVPHPGNSNLYYLFTCDYWGFANGLRYSIIDMSQQSGLGAVTATKNVLLYTPCTEKILAVRHCNGRDFWLITHVWQSNIFKVYLIDQNGLNTTPLQFAIGSTHTGGTAGYYNSAGQMTVNKTGDRIALTIFDAGIIELFNFNASTGAITSPVSFSGYPEAWGMEFSPNSRYLYLTKWTQAGVWQFDLISNNAATISASVTSVGTVTGPHATYKAGYLKLAPDDKIYIAKYNSGFLGVINNPDQPAATCGFVDNGFNLGGGLSQVGLCNTFVQDPAGYNASIAFTSVCAGTPASFALSHALGAQSVSWNFGDPSSGTQDTSSAMSPTHNYANGGTYNVTAIVHYLCVTDTMNLSVTITGQPVCSYTSSVNCSTHTVNFTNNSTGATSYSWDFGDSNQSTSTSPSHTYAASGTYTVILSATGACGTALDTQVVTIGNPATAQFNYAVASCNMQVNFTNNSSNATSYSWNFGDSNQSTSVSPSHTYAASGTYTVVLTATGACGTSTSTQVITVNNPAVMAQYGYTLSNCGTQVNCTNGSVNATSYVWDFGDGNQSAQNNPIHTYSASGTYTLTLIASGACGNDTTTQLVTINSGVQAGFTTAGGTCGTPVQFSNTSTNATTYNWDFGDSNTNTQASPSHTYNSAGTYTVTLIVGGACGNDTISQTVVVTSGMTVAASPDTSICAGESVTLTATGSGNYQWSGGSSDTTANITVSPSSTTSYYVTSGSSTCLSQPDTVTVTVLSAPVVSVTGSQPVCPGDTFHLAASGANSYLWLPANLTGSSVDVSPSQSGTISVIGTNANGCSDTEQVYLQVYPTEDISIHGPPIMCVGEAIGLTATGTGTFTWAPPTGLSSTTGASVIATPTVTTTYTVTVVDTNGCAFIGTYTITVFPCTGIIEASGDGALQVVPNPGSGLFTLYTGALRNDAGLRLEIFDVRGRRVFSDEPDGGTEIQLDLRNLPDGMYLLVADSEKTHAVTRLIIAR